MYESKSSQAQRFLSSDNLDRDSITPETIHVQGMVELCSMQILWKKHRYVLTLRSKANGRFIEGRGQRAEKVPKVAFTCQGTLLFSSMADQSISHK